MKYLILAIKLVGGFVIALAAFGSIIETTTLMPEFAVVYMDPVSSTFFGPTCLPTTSGQQRELAGRLAAAQTRDEAGAAILSVTKLTPGPAGSARQMGLKPDRACQKQGAFIATGRSLSGMYLEKLGFLPESRPRWNIDGSWNW